MKIGTAVFREAIKAIEANRLGEEYAVEAVNCDLRTGAIVPINGAANCMTAPAGAERIHYWKGQGRLLHAERRVGPEAPQQRQPDLGRVGLRPASPAGVRYAVLRGGADWAPGIF